MVRVIRVQQGSVPSDNHVQVHVLMSRERCRAID